jgi:hypothetical protein
MLETYKELGIDALELDLRNSFMGKMMMNQARTVVEQTIRLVKCSGDLNTQHLQFLNNHF